MKNKNQKLVSRIICGMLVPLFLFLNAGASLVAYAAPKTPAPATPAAPVTCPTTPPGFTESKSGDCMKKGYKEGDTCPDKYHPNKTDSILNTDAKDGKPAVEGILYCSPDASIAPVDAKVITNGIAIIAGIQRGLNRLIWPVLVLTGGLMGNDLLFGNGMEEKLRDVWIPIRNLVNILFVIVLVGLALYNVLGLADDNTSIKSMLPKIVIGIIAVNFSFLAIKVVLDGINVMTTAVFALPQQVSTGLGEVMSPEAEQPRLCAALEGTPFARFEDMGDDLITQQKEKAAYVQVAMNNVRYKDAGVKTGDSIEQVNQAIKALDTKNGDKGALEEKFKKDVGVARNAELCTGKKLSSQGKLFLARYNSRNAAFALALNMGKIVFYNDIDTKSLGSGTDALEKIFTNSLFSMVLYVIYCVSFIALFIVLLGRLVVMWLSIAVSPILLLMIASPQVKEKMGGFSKLSEQFTKNAIAPLLIALSMTVGWIMLKAVQGLELSTSLDGSLLNINPSNGIPVASMNTLQDFMVALGVIAVVWMGVFSAADGTIAEGATKWIKDKVETAGKFVGQIPFKHLPLIPIALPDHPHDHYTFSQLGNYIENIGRDKDVDKLWNNAKGETNANEGNLRNYRDEAGLKNWLVNAKKGSQDLSDEKYRAPIKDWLTANKTEADRIRSSGSKGKALITDMETLRDSNDDKKRKKAALDINKNDILSGIKGELEPPKATTPSAAPAAAATTPKGPKPGEIKKGDAVGKSLTKKDEPKEDTDARIKKVNEEKDKIDTALKNTNSVDKREGLQAGLKEIAAASKAAGGKGDVAAVKAILGDAKYNEVDTALKAQGGVAAVLTPPAPQTPAAPARAVAAEPIKIDVAANVNTTVSPQQGTTGGDNGALPRPDGQPANTAKVDVKTAKPQDSKPS